MSPSASSPARITSRSGGAVPLGRPLGVTILAIAIAIAIVGAGCSRGDDGEGERRPTGSSGTPAAADPSRVRIDVRSESDVSGETGTFAMSGAVDDAGTFSTVDNRDEGGLDRTFDGAKGKLVLHIQLLRVGPGVVEFEWSVRSGTGEYEGASGEGRGDHRLSSGRLEGVLTGTLER